MALSNLLVNERLMAVGRMIVKEDNGTDSSESAKPREVVSSSSFSSEDDEVDIIGDENEVGDEEEERYKREIYPEGANLALFLFSCLFTFCFLLFTFERC